MLMKDQKTRSFDEINKTKMLPEAGPHEATLTLRMDIIDEKPGRGSIYIQATDGGELYCSLSYIDGEMAEKYADSMLEQFFSINEERFPGYENLTGITKKVFVVLSKHIVVDDCTNQILVAIVSTMEKAKKIWEQYLDIESEINNHGNYGTPVKKTNDGEDSTE